MRLKYLISLRLRLNVLICYWSKLRPHTLTNTNPQTHTNTYTYALTPTHTKHTHKKNNKKTWKFSIKNNNKQCSIVFDKTYLDNNLPPKYTLFNIRLIGLVGRVFTNGPGDLGSIPGRVLPKTLKMVLDISLLNTYVSRVKRSNPGKGVAPSLTSRCSSYWKGSLLVGLDYGRQLYLLICIYIYM